MIERGYRPFVVIRPENDASRNLYKKLGFAKAFETCRVTLNPTKLGLAAERMIVLQPHLLRAAELAEEAAQQHAGDAAAAVPVDDEAMAEALDANGDEGIEDGRNEDTISLRRQERGRVGGIVNEEDRDEGIDDEDEDLTQNDDAAGAVEVGVGDDDAAGAAGGGDDDGGGD